MEIVLATHNKDKIKEIENLFAGLDIKIIKNIELPEVIEDKDTLLGNALKKAREICSFTGKPALSDDTGLEVDALNGAPGVYSARYAGENATYSDSVNKLLSEMEGKTDRRAVFKTCVALAFPDGKEIVAYGETEGEITKKGFGEKGFGYDPVFFVKERGKTYSEMTIDEKNSCSHRAKALKNLLEMISKECL